MTHRRLCQAIFVKMINARVIFRSGIALIEQTPKAVGTKRGSAASARVGLGRHRMLLLVEPTGSRERTVARPACERTPPASATRYRASHGCAARLVSNLLLDLSEGSNRLVDHLIWHCVAAGCPLLENLSMEDLDKLAADVVAGGCEPADTELADSESADHGEDGPARTHGHGDQ
jgi:hypothetical protein